MNGDIKERFRIPIIDQSISLAGLIELQSSSGKFPLGNYSCRNILLERFSPGLLEEMAKYLKESSPRGPMSLIIRLPVQAICETLIVTVYIEMKFVNSFDDWQPVIRKARDWMQKKIKDSAVRNTLETMARVGFRNIPSLADTDPHPPSTKDDLTTHEDGQESVDDIERNQEGQSN
jgi:hypothetical protein